jgi:hypothetical protein
MIIGFLTKGGKADFLDFNPKKSRKIRKNSERRHDNGN